MVDIAVKRNLWIVANCHGVTTKHGLLSFKSITPDFLDKHLSYIHSQSSDIWVDTFTKIFEYMFQRSQTTIEIRSNANSAVDFVMHNNKEGVKLSSPMTVVVKMPAGENVKSARSADGHALKAWVCGIDQTCVDVDVYDQEIHLQLSR